MSHIDNPNTRKNIDDITGKAYDKYTKKKRQAKSRLITTIQKSRKYLRDAEIRKIIEDLGIIHKST